MSIVTRVARNEAGDARLAWVSVMNSPMAVHMVSCAADSPLPAPLLRLGRGCCDRDVEGRRNDDKSILHDVDRAVRIRVKAVWRRRGACQGSRLHHAVVAVYVNVHATLKPTICAPRR